MTLTAMQLNQELQKQISIIADDENLVSKAINYIKVLVSYKEKKDSVQADKHAKLEKILSMTTPAPFSEEEIAKETERGREEFYVSREE